jgi:uncharacterized protein (DUF433 family)
VVTVHSLSRDQESYRKSLRTVSNLDQKLFDELSRLDEENIRKAKFDYIQEALEEIRENLNCQTAAVFLFSKNRNLERFCMVGGTAEKPINQDFIPEKYEPQENNPVWEVARNKEPKVYDDFNNSNDGEIFSTPEFRTKYEKEFGVFECVHVYPLEANEGRIYGILRVIFDKKENPVELHSRLVSYTQVLFQNLLSFRRSLQGRIKKDLSDRVNEMLRTSRNGEKTRDMKEEILEAFCKNALTLLIENLDTAFLAGSIHIEKEGKEFYTVAECFPKVEQNLEKVEIENDLRKVKSSKEYDSFRHDPGENQGRNGLRSNIKILHCFPLILNDECFGTLSLWVEDGYNLHPEGYEFIGEVASKIAEAVEDSRSTALFCIDRRLGASGIFTPVIQGTNIRVQAIVIAHFDWKQSPSEIANEYNLSQPQVNSALAYYETHRIEIDAGIKTEEDLEPAHV